MASLPLQRSFKARVHVHHRPLGQPTLLAFMKRPGFAVFVCVCPKSATWESLRASGVQGMETMEKVAWTQYF